MCMLEIRVTKCVCIQALTNTVNQDRSNWETKLLDISKKKLDKLELAYPLLLPLDFSLQLEVQLKFQYVLNCNEIVTSTDLVRELLFRFLVMQFLLYLQVIDDTELVLRKSDCFVTHLLPVTLLFTAAVQLSSLQTDVQQISTKERLLQAHSPD